MYFMQTLISDPLIFPSETCRGSELQDAPLLPLLPLALDASDESSPRSLNKRIQAMSIQIRTLAQSYQYHPPPLQVRKRLGPLGIWHLTVLHGVP